MTEIQKSKTLKDFVEEFVEAGWEATSVVRMFSEDGQFAVITAVMKDTKELPKKEVDDNITNKLLAEGHEAIDIVRAIEQ